MGGISTSEGLSALVNSPEPEAEMEKKFGVSPPPIAKTLNGDAWYAEHYSRVTSRWLDNVYDESVSQVSMDEEAREASRYIQILMGKHWPMDRPAYKSKPVVNFISKFFWDLVATLTDVKLNINIKTENQQYTKLAETLTRATQANWRNQRGMNAAIFAIMHATLGVGYLKVGPSRDDDDITYLPSGGDSTFPILGNPYDLQKSAGIIHQSWQPIWWFREKWPGVGEDVQPEMSVADEPGRERPGYIPEYTWNAVSPSLRRFLYSASMIEPNRGSGAWGSGKIPVALYTEFWFKDPTINTSSYTLQMGAGNWSYEVPPGKRIYPFGRLICTAQRSNRKILYDNTNFHWHGKFPFGMLKLQPVPWSWSGISEFRDLWPINHAMDQVLADGLDIQKQALNPTLVVQDKVIAEETWNKYFPGIPGAKLRVHSRGVPIDQVLRFIAPNIGVLSTIPALYNILRSAFNELAGFIDAGALLSKKQVPSSGSVESIRESQQSKFRIKGLFLESFIEDVGRLVMSDIIQFYTQRRTITMLGKDAWSWEHFDYDPSTLVPYSEGTNPYERGREFVKQFSMYVVSGSSLPSQRTENARIALGLRMRKDMSRESMYERLSLAGYSMPDPKTEELRLKEEFNVPVTKKQAQSATQASAPSGVVST